jgi:O-antigen ligase
VLLALVAMTRKESLELSALAVLGIISLATGTRGMTGTMVIAAVLIVSRGVARQRSLAVRIAATMLIGVAAVTAALTLGGSLLNSSLASSARDRFQQQAAVNSNPILAGRTEPPISISAVMAYPLIGAGANPEPTPEIVSRALQIADVLGYKNPNSLVAWWTQNNQIYTHSLVMETWVVGGLLAALPFIAACGVFGAGLVRSLRARRSVPALAIFLAVQSFSDTLVAPETFGSAAFVGLSAGLVIATLLTPSGTRESLSGEVDKSSHPRSQFRVAQGLSH